MAAKSSKYKQPITGRSEQARIMDEMYEESRKQREEHERYQRSAPQAPEGKRKLTTYEVEVYRRTYTQTGHGTAKGATHLKAIKKHLIGNLKKGSYAVIVMNKNTGKQVSGPKR